MFFYLFNYILIHKRWRLIGELRRFCSLHIQQNLMCLQPNNQSFFALYMYSPLLTAHSNGITQGGAASQIKDGVRLRWWNTTVLLCSMNNNTASNRKSLKGFNVTFFLLEEVYDDSDSLVQTRSGSLHSPPVQTARPVPFTISCNFSHSNLMEVPSGNLWLWYISSLRIISCGALGRSQSAAGTSQMETESVLF